MAISDRVLNAAKALLGISAYSAIAPPYGYELDDQMVEQIRRAFGGQLQPLPTTRTRWFLADLETAQQQADQGDIGLVAQLMRSLMRDGMIGGLMKTRTSGLVALPKRFRGSEDIIAALTEDNGTRSVFDEMFPPAELALLAQDGIGCGVGVGELIPVEGRDYPVLVRLHPEFLRYRWVMGRWYYRSVAGELPITPGDGRWILHTPGGRLTPWQSGLWLALGRAYIMKEHALLHRANFSAKLANPARMAYAPQGSTEAQRAGFLASLLQWGLNTAFELPAGWDAKLLETSGRGWEVFGAEIDSANLEAMITLAGQVVTVTGGAGFSNADIHRTIRADLIKETGDALAHTLNTQGIPAFVVERFGPDALAQTARVEYDTAPPEDRQTEAAAMAAIGQAVAILKASFLETGMQVDVIEFARRFGIPLEKAPEVTPEIAALPESGDAREAGPDEELAAAEALKVPDAPEPGDNI